MSSRYEIREQIGKGGLGAVYKAFDTQLQREVAMKRVLSPDQATEEEVKEAASKLIAEAQTLSTLNHPNIITVFDVGQDDEGGFVVMELLKGETLNETIERGVLTQEDFTEVVYQTMEALIAAQAANVIHRDIKPTNIMVIWQASGKFQIKILDFGLAKFSKSPSVQTMDQEDSVLGSIFFMAPEQFERGELDARTDIYQMGCVFYNALTGQYPFNGDTAPQVMNAHLQHKVIPLDQVRPDLPPAICQWVMWLINRDIDHRPADARDALKRWPKNPDPAEIPVATALPVEETPEVSSSQVRIVTAESSASAPPALIVTGTAPQPDAATGRLQTGATTGRLQTGATTVRLTGSTTSTTRRPGSANLKKSGSGGSGHKGKMIIIGAAAGIIMAALGVKVVMGKKEAAKKARILELSKAEKPTGSAADILTAIEFIGDRSTPPATRTDAIKILENLSGNGIEDALHTTLKESESTPMKMLLARVLSERGYAAAVPTILQSFHLAKKDNEKVVFLNAVKGLASQESLDQILGALQGDHSREIRRIFEDTVLAVLRRESNPDTEIEKMLTRVSTTSGNERKSLFRILGVLGSDAVKTRLKSIYNNKNDPEYQRDAMNAYSNWQDRNVLPEVENIINTTEDKPLGIAARASFAKLAALPGAEPLEKRIEIWNKAFQFADNQNDVRRLVSNVIEYPSPLSLKMLQEWAKHEKYGAFAKGAVGTMQKTITSVPELAPGDEIKGNKSRVQGHMKASFNSFLEAITGWTSPETSFTWSFKVKEAGEYSIVVKQASVREANSEFRIYIDGKTLEGQSQKTDSLEDFQPVKLDGTVPLQPGTVYTLSLVAGKKVEPRMMDIGAIQLVK